MKPRQKWIFAEVALSLQQAQAVLIEARNRATQQARVAAPVAVQTVAQALAAGSIRIDAGIDEKHLHMLVLGMAARAVVDAYPAQPFDAQLSYIGPAVDPQRGTVEVRLALPQPLAFRRDKTTRCHAL